MKSKTVEFTLKDLLPLGLTFVVTGIVLAYGLNITADIQDDLGAENCPSTHTSYNETANQCYNSSNHHVDVTAHQFNATSDVLSSVSNLTEKIPTLATVTIAAVIIGVLITAFAFRS